MRHQQRRNQYIFIYGAYYFRKFALFCRGIANTAEVRENRNDFEALYHGIF